MRVDRIIRNERRTIEDILYGLDHRLTARENFGPEGTLGQALISNGPDEPPSFQDIASTGGVTLEQVLELLGAHEHAGEDITSGQVGPQFLGSGSRDGSKFLRDDGVWAAPTATVAWGDITGIPTDFAGYGLDDDISAALALYLLAAYTYTELVFTTASLAQDALEAFDSASWGNAGVIWRVRVDSVNANNVCWVRIYGNADQRTADEATARDYTDDPDAGISVMGDLIFIPSFLDLDCAPVIPFINQDHTTHDGKIKLTVTNKGSGGAQVYTVRVSVIQLEA